MGIEEFTVSMTNRSLRTVKAELEFLADNSIISRQQLSGILAQLPAETSITGDAPTTVSNRVIPIEPVSTTPVLPYRSNSAITNNEKQNNFFGNQSQPSPAPPPSYGAVPVAPPPPSAPILTHVVALYPYNATDAGDLALQTNDSIAVTEYMNAEWWKGRNERTGQEGIFPRSYVRVEDKAVPPQPSSYGNAPMDVSQGVQPEADKKKGMASKVGGKLGNAALFGAGATIGSNIVNSIF